MPASIFPQKSSRGTTHRIIIAFFLLCVSVLVITEGDLPALAGVYTISFLAVMALFGLGNLFLKTTRARLPRPSSAPLLSVLIAIGAVVIGLIGNCLMNMHYLLIFLEYFVPALVLVTIMLERTTILKGFLFVVRSMLMFFVKRMTATSQTIRAQIDSINSQQIVFTRGDNLANLNQAMLYVQRNEDTNRIKVVNVVRKEEDTPANLPKDLAFLNEAYPDIDIEFVPIVGSFGPDLITQLSEQWKIPPNLMFIGSREIISSTGLQILVEFG